MAVTATTFSKAACSATPSNGGAGIDTIGYADSSVGVTVNLATGAASGGNATGDTYTSIENARGSSFDDVLTGSAGVNSLTGGGRQ